MPSDPEKLRALLDEMAKGDRKKPWSVWTVEFRERALKAERELSELKAALACPSSDYDPPTHRCIRCDSEVGP
jgi:hypothetical protein